MQVEAAVAPELWSRPRRASEMLHGQMVHLGHAPQPLLIPVPPSSFSMCSICCVLFVLLFLSLLLPLRVSFSLPSNFVSPPPPEGALHRPSKVSGCPESRDGGGRRTREEDILNREKEHERRYKEPGEISCPPPVVHVGSMSGSARLSLPVTAFASTKREGREKKVKGARGHADSR
jgi:hypothetical protein